MQHPELNETIESLCLSIIVKIRNFKGQYDKGLLSILELFGNAQEKIEVYEAEEMRHVT
jgi:hypothetical protein